MKKRILALALALGALGAGGMMAASARPIIIRNPCNGQAELHSVEPGTTGDLNGNGDICVTDY